jgi:predicted enzyme related to lactoylglutathione lyase
MLPTGSQSAISSLKDCAATDMRPTPIAAVLVHAPDWRAGLAWYTRAFPSARPVRQPGQDWECIEVDGVAIEVVLADEKVPSGAAGTVVYWWADDFDARRAQLESLRAVLYRGPMEIEDGLVMCQFKDPFGNLLGVRGRRPPAAGSARARD